MSILDYKPCHIPLKYRCPVKMNDHIRPTCLTTYLKNQEFQEAVLKTCFASHSGPIYEIIFAFGVQA